MEQAVLNAYNKTIAMLQGWTQVDGDQSMWRDLRGEVRAELPNWAGDMTTAKQLLLEMQAAKLAVGLYVNPLNGEFSPKGWVAYCRSTFDRDLVNTWKYYHFEFCENDPEVAICRVYISWKDWVLSHPSED